MTPSHARKRSRKYRHHISSVLVQGQPELAGSVRRVPAAEIENVVICAVRQHMKLPANVTDGDFIKTHVARVEIQSNRLAIKINTPTQPTNTRRAAGTQKAANTIYVPWRKLPFKRKRVIIVPKAVTSEDVRPIRANRATFDASTVPSAKCGQLHTHRYTKGGRQR